MDSFLCTWARPHAEGQKEAPGGGEVVFIPTGCMALLETLHDSRPNHSIIAADFDHLPDVKVWKDVNVWTFFKV